MAGWNSGLLLAAKPPTPPAAVGPRDMFKVELSEAGSLDLRSQSRSGGSGRSTAWRQFHRPQVQDSHKKSVRSVISLSTSLSMVVEQHLSTLQLRLQSFSTTLRSGLAFLNEAERTTNSL